MISLLNKLGRRMVSDRGEKLNNPRLFSSTAKRVLSVLFLLILGFSFLPTFDIHVSAASGLSNVTYTVLEDGAVEITATVTPDVVNGSVGEARLVQAYMISSDGYRDWTSFTSIQMLTGSYRTVSTWRGVAYPPEDGTWRVYARIYDTTSGSSRYALAETSAVLDLKYNRNGTWKPAISAPSASQHATDKTKVNFNLYLWCTGSRRATNISYYRGDANGENGQLVYSKSMPAGDAGHPYTYEGLTAGTTYTFWYTISSPIGTSTSAKYVVTPGTPSAPTNMYVVPGNAGGTIYWSEPANKNGATIVGYNIYGGASSTSPLNGSTPVTNMYLTRSGTNGRDLYDGDFGIAAVTSDGKVGARGYVSGRIRVGSPQPVANACCIMHNAYCIMLNAECRMEILHSLCSFRMTGKEGGMTNSSGGFLLCMSFRARTEGSTPRNLIKRKPRNTDEVFRGFDAV